MPNYIGKERPMEVEVALSEAEALRNKLIILKLKLAHINQEPRTDVYSEKNENWGPSSRYLIGNDVECSDDTLSENYSMLNDIAGNEYGTQTLLRCQFCDIDIMVCVQHDNLENAHVFAFDPEKMICPVCDEKFEEDTINFVENSILQKRNWKSENYNISSGTYTIDKKLPSWGNNNVSVPRLTDIQSSSSDSDSDEDFNSIHSDTSTAKSSETEAADTDDEQENDEEKSLRANFVGNLVLSTMI